MVITFVCPPNAVTGGLRVVAVFADRLARRGHSVRVVFPKDPPQRLKLRLLKFVSALLPFGKPPCRQSTFFDDAACELIYLDHPGPIVERDVPDGDIVIATWWETAEWVSGLSAAKGVKAYLVQHHEVFDYLPKVRSAATYRLPMHKIVVSRWLKEIMQDEYGDADVSLVPITVDMTQFATEPRDKNAIPRIGMMYSETTWKRSDIGVEAIEIVRQEIPNLEVVMFGTEPAPKDTPLPKGTQYHQRPPQSFIPELYASCDVWLSSSDAEGFGLPALEAMACRCPVVSTAVGGMVDFVRDGESGYLAPVGNPQALAEGILRVLRLSDRAWRSMSDQAFKTASFYTWDDACVLFEQALQHALSAKADPARGSDSAVRR